MKQISKKELYSTAAHIKMLILDVDGVLTDGGIILDNEGNELKAFHVRDGHGLKMLVRAGIRVALITGRYSKVVERRARELKIKDVYQKCYDKTAAYRQLLKTHSLSDRETAYIGDDIVDIPLLRRCGLPITVLDADDAVKPFVKMVTKTNGGRGAVREVCDFLLKAKGMWKDILDEYTET